MLVCFLVAILGIQHPTASERYQVPNILALEFSLVSVFDTVNAVRSYLMERP